MHRGGSLPEARNQPVHDQENHVRAVVLADGQTWDCNGNANQHWTTPT
ncbi:hypothetical protein [Streptomyces sp. A1277]|nr:hypothetical protein [Streptomyces sp. A1277]